MHTQVWYVGRKAGELVESLSRDPPITRVSSLVRISTVATRLESRRLIESERLTLAYSQTMPLQMFLKSLSLNTKSETIRRLNLVSTRHLYRDILYIKKKIQES